MSNNVIMARFTKCGGDLRKLRVKFHHLSRDAKERALELIRGGEVPAKAIERAKK